MTKEEAITRLKGLYGNGYMEQEQALDMAIRALKNEQTDGDLISRKDVINMFNTMDRYKADKLILQDTDRKFPGNEVFIVDDCYELLEQLPTYSAQQKIGHWISLDDFRGKYNEKGFMCSECGEHIDFEENFCPNCGAKMTERKANEDSN